MNAPTIITTTAPTVKPVDFVVADALTPFQLGALDAEQGELCVPEMYFARRSQMIEYAHGYESITGPDLLSSSFTGNLPILNPAAMGEAEFAEYAAAELADLIDGIETADDLRRALAGF